METKPGYLTTEFWVSILSGIYMVLNTTGLISQIPNKWAAVALAVITAAYTVARGVAKQGIAYDPTVRDRR